MNNEHDNFGFAIKRISWMLHDNLHENYFDSTINHVI